MSGILQVLYTCKGCGIVDAPVTVAHRKHGQEIVAWMDYVRQRIADDHSTRSPICNTKVADVKIPLKYGQGIGYPA